MFGWFKKKKSVEVKELPYVAPYNNKSHKGYPEIQITFDGTQYRWIVVIYSYDGAGVQLERTSGSNFTREDAMRNAIKERNNLLTKVVR